MDIPKITVEEARRRELAGEPVLYVDSRSGHAWESATEQLPGSLRIPPAEAELHALEVPPGRVVVAYCT